MLPEKMVKARLSFVEGKHAQLPNLVLVPAAKTFPVTVEWSMEAESSYVIGSADPAAAHRWCVLDSNLKQVMHGAAGKGRKASRKTEATVSRTLHGGGAANPRQVTLDFTSAKLKNGAAYTLIASRHGLIAAGEFVAVRQPQAKPTAKKTAKKKAPARKAGAKTKKTPARKKKTPARKKTAA